VSKNIAFISEFIRCTLWAETFKKRKKDNMRMVDFKKSLFDFIVSNSMTPNEKGLAFVGELEFRLPITKAQ
jgi:hypothetical protein